MPIAIGFDRPVGAAADVKELEYVSALHQTCMPRIRMDGSIRDVDIVNLLSSRYGIQVTPDEVRETIMRGLGGDSGGARSGNFGRVGSGARQGRRLGRRRRNVAFEIGNDDYFEADDDDVGGGSVIDLMEVVSILIIPTLIKAAGQVLAPAPTSPPYDDEEDGKEGEASPGDDGETAGASSLADGRRDEERRQRPHQQRPPQPGRYFHGGPGGVEDEEEEEAIDYSEILQPRRGLLHYVVNMILHDVTGSAEPKVLDRELLRRIFTAYGEKELAGDDQLLDEMIAAAASSEESQAALPSERESSTLGRAPSPGGGHAQASTTIPSDEPAAAEASGKDDGPVTPGRAPIFLNKESFARALTNDVLLYDVANEVRLSTNYFDVFKTHNSSHVEDNDGGEKVEVRAESTTTAVPEEDENGDGNGGGGVAVDVVEATDGGGGEEEQVRPVRKVFTAAAIDFVAGSYRSKLLVVCLWASLILGYFLYDFIIGEEDQKFCSELVAEQQISFAVEYVCLVAQGVVLWLLRAMSISVRGLGFIGLGSIGNSVDCEKIRRPVIGMLCTVFLSLVQEITIPKNIGGDAVFLWSLTLAFSLAATACHLIHILSMCVPRKFVESNVKIKRLFTPGAILSESLTKRSASSKVQTMISNALHVTTKNEGEDNVIDTHFGHALLSYSKLGKKFERAGGFRWTWSRIFNRNLFAREGIWFTARLLANNATQLVTTIFILWAGIRFAGYVEENFTKESVKGAVNTFVLSVISTSVSDHVVNDAAANISGLVNHFYAGQLNGTAYNNCPGADILAQGAGSSELIYPCNLISIAATNNSSQSYAHLAALQAAGFDVDAMKHTTRSAILIAVDQQVENLYPAESYMIVVPLIVLSVMAFLNGLFLTSTYIPSATSTTLKLRSGVIPTFRDPNFWMHRVAPDQVTILSGSLFWGCFYSSILFGSVVGLVVFFFLWQVTRHYMIRLTAIILGGLVTLGVKIILLCFCRCSFYRAFYRTKPARANMASLALEFVNFVFSSLFVLWRMVKLLLIAVLYVGRVDSPLLAPGVGDLGNIRLDNHPNIFIKDILSHDAHRHPYIELLSVVYMMKLRYGENFGKTSGSGWRLIFVYALMPWMSKYRVLARPEMYRDEGEDRNSHLRRSLEVSLSTKFRALRTNFDTMVVADQVLEEEVYSGHKNDLEDIKSSKSIETEQYLCSRGQESGLTSDSQSTGNEKVELLYAANIDNVVQLETLNGKSVCHI